MGARLGRKVLITGGAGFVGSHVADAHIAAGDRVWVLDDLSTGRIENVPAAAEFARLDVADPRTRDFVAQGCFDVVSHHAAQVSVPASVADPAADARANLIGLIHVLEGARAGGTARVVFVSSGGVVYGEPDRCPTPETAPKRPVSPYGVAKLAGEHYLYYYRVAHGLEGVALRYSNVFGPRQSPIGEAGVVAIFANRLLEDEPLVIYGDGGQVRDYVYVDDVARANLLAAAMPLDDGPGLDARAYNVGTGVATSVNALAGHMEEVAGAEGAGRRHRAGRPGDVRRSTLSPDRLRARGWAPQVTLREGLAQTFDRMAAAPATADREARRRREAGPRRPAVAS